MDMSLGTNVNVRRDGDEILISLPTDEQRCAIVLVAEARCQYRSPDSRIWHSAENESDALERAK